MKPCYKCGKGVIVASLICGDCKDKEGLSLEHYIDQLAEDIVLNYPSASCELCINRSCEQQVSGLTCRNGVKEFLVKKMNEYAKV